MHNEQRHSVRLLDVGRSDIPGPELYWMRDFFEWYELCFQVAVVQGPDSLVLINTGPAADLSAMNAGWAQFLGERAAMRSRPGMHVLAQLKELGISPAEVTHIALTPLQLYTVSNVLEFDSAEICISRRGWEHLHAGRAVLHDARETSIPADILGPLVTTHRDRIRLLEDEDEIVPGVRTWWSGGHHRASITIDVDTSDGVVVLSDSFFYLENVVEDHPIGISENVWECLDAYERVRRTASTIVPLYDPKNFERFPGGVVA